MRSGHTRVLTETERLSFLAQKLEVLDSKVLTFYLLLQIEDGNLNLDDVEKFARIAQLERPAWFGEQGVEIQPGDADAIDDIARTPLKPAAPSLKTRRSK